MRAGLIVGLALLPVAAWAAPRQQLSLAVPMDGAFFGGAPPPAASPGRYQPAPTPNREVTGPAGPRTSNQASVSPTLFTNQRQFRGDGFSPGSTAQGEQERNLRPAAGFLLHMPLAPQ